MLKNIEIENFGSYKNFSGLAENNYFKKMNIIYGANYSGKTTLSRIFSLLKSKAEPENYLNPKFKLIFESEIVDLDNYKENSRDILIFNKDFINENLSFLVFNSHESGSIKSFDAVVVGQDQIAIDNKINELQLKIKLFTQIEDRLNIILNSIFVEKKDINEEKLKTTKNKEDSLTKKARELELSGLNVARTYRRPNLTSDIEKILKKNPQLIRKLTEEEIVKKINDMKVSKKPEINISNKVGEIKKIIDQHIINCNSKLKEVFEKNRVNEINELFKEWVLKGYHLHKEHNKDHCEFCGGELKKSLLEGYEIFINQKEEIIIDEIKKLIDFQDRISRALSILIDGFVEPDAYFYDSYKNEYITFREDVKSKVFDFLENLSLLKDKLDMKLVDIGVEVNFDFSLFKKSFDSLMDSYIKVIDICNKNDDFSKNIENEQNKIKVEVLEERIVEYLIEFDWGKKENRLKELELANGRLKFFEQINMDRFDELNNFKSNIDDEILKLNALKSSQSAASDLVNKFLNSFFGHESLSLIPLEEEKGKFKIVRNGIEAYNLSEGECTLVAFCYFIALVYNLKNTDKLKDHLIYIDDPISSLDSNNIFYVYSLIENVICKKVNYNQFFISTHNLEFFKYLRKLTIPVNHNRIKSCSDPKCESTKKNKNEDVGFYFIRKENNISELVVLPNYLRKYNTEFNYLFSQIWNCAHETVELTPDQIYNFSNNMRKFFEVYNYFKYPSDHNKSVFRESFFDAENNLNHFKLVERIANEYSHAEEIFDRTMRPISSHEMIDAAKFILLRLEANDEVQYNALVQSTKDLRDEV